MLLILMIISAFSISICSGASALQYHERHPWMANVGVGIGRGRFEDIDETERVYRSGAVPQIRFGRMIGSRLQLSVNYQGWIIEFDRFGDTVLEDVKIRRSLQDLTLGLALFPAGPEGFLGGFYIRAGAGIGWAGTAVIPVHEGGKQEHGERHDDWGTGYVAEIGYELWISGNAAVGLIGSYNYLDIDGDIVEKAWFTSANLTLSLYF
jgi:hypothetical protein